MGKDEAKLLVQNRTPYNKLRSGGRQGGIKHTVTASEITAALGFAPNMQPSSDGKYTLNGNGKPPTARFAACGITRVHAGHFMGQGRKWKRCLALPTCTAAKTKPNHQRKKAK